MYNLWLVLRVLGEVIVSVGPVHMPMERCQAWAQREKEALMIEPDVKTKPGDFVFTCEWSVVRPGVKHEQS